MRIFSCFLYKSLTAAGAGDIYLSLALGHTEIILAARTLEKAEVLALAQLILLTAEKILYLVPHAHELLVLSTASGKIPGKHTIKAKHYQHSRKRGYQHYPRYTRNKIQHKRGNKHRKGKWVSSIPTCHKSSYPIQNIRPLLLRQYASACLAISNYSRFMPGMQYRKF